MQATIQVKYDNPPKPGKKMANVKDAAGVTYFYYPDKMGFQAGETVTIDYDVQDWGGKPMNVVKAIVPNGYRGPQQAQSVAAPSYTPAPAGHNGAASRTSAREMFIMGVVGRAMGSGKFGAQDIYGLTAAASDAWIAAVENGP
jgi:hypothetical protein